MAQINLEPAFDAECCCGNAAAQSSGNPNLYYDSTIFANPNAAGLLPANPSLPCMAFELNGNGAIFVWNPAIGTWKSN
jgi:hypothetical protein